jgi:phage baseplate assembly protein W
MSHEPLGWPLLPLPDADGLLSWPDLESSVSQQLRVLLQTRPGEQLMQPAFGAGLENLLEEPDTLETRRRLRDLILNSISAWENRVQLQEVTIEGVPGSPGKLRAEITYRIRYTGTYRRTGLTLELRA